MLSNIWVWDPGSDIRDPESGKNLFRIRNTEKSINTCQKIGQNFGPGSRTQWSKWHPKNRKTYGLGIRVSD